MTSVTRRTGRHNYDLTLPVTHKRPTILRDVRHESTAVTGSAQHLIETDRAVAEVLHGARDMKASIPLRWAVICGVAMGVSLIGAWLSTWWVFLLFALYWSVDHARSLYDNRMIWFKRTIAEDALLLQYQLLEAQFAHLRMHANDPSMPRQCIDCDGIHHGYVQRPHLYELMVEDSPRFSAHMDTRNTGDAS